MGNHAFFIAKSAVDFHRVFRIIEPVKFGEEYDYRTLYQRTGDY